MRRAVVAHELFPSRLKRRFVFQAAFIQRAQTARAQRGGDRLPVDAPVGGIFLREKFLHGARLREGVQKARPVRPLRAQLLTERQKRLVAREVIEPYGCLRDIGGQRRLFRAQRGRFLQTVVQAFERFQKRLGYGHVVERAVYAHERAGVFKRRAVVAEFFLQAGYRLVLFSFVSEQERAAKALLLVSAAFGFQRFMERTFQADCAQGQRGEAVFGQRAAVPRDRRGHNFTSFALNVAIVHHSRRFVHRCRHLTAECAESIIFGHNFPY